jgi:hypothetical protein
MRLVRNSARMEERTKVPTQPSVANVMDIIYEAE